MSVPKFIIDTDPGIDDAMALCMALEQHRLHRIEIVAITLVCGNTTLEYQKINIVRILQLFPDLIGKIPVFVGCHEGLVHRHIYTDRFHGIDGFNMVEFENACNIENPSIIDEDEPACQAMVRLVKNCLGEISLILLGPLTNLAMCTKLDPAFLGRVKHFFVMGGSMEAVGNTTSMAEFNFYADPEAAHVVLKKLEEIKPIKLTIVTWELCHSYFYISWDWRLNVLGRIQDERAKLFNRLEEKWNQERSFGDQWILCDQLIMAVAIDDECIKEVQDCHASVELHGVFTRGLMAVEKRSFVNDHTEKLNVRIIKKLNEDLVKKYLLQGLGHRE